MSNPLKMKQTSGLDNGENQVVLELVMLIIK